MRTLLILRGAPGAGKSTWIEQNGLLPYTLSPDTLRVMCSSRELQADGRFAIARNQATEKQTWKIVLDLLEYRMSRGELTVLDATASKTKDIQQYKDLAEQYRYRSYVVDFTNVPLEVCLKQNKQRHPDKWVPEDSIRNIYARFANQPVPGRVEVIKPDELYKILEKPIDLSNYKKIVFVGDIHGCYDTLMQYPDFKEGLKDDTAYIFTGDYVDRGNQNAEVMHFLYSIMDKPNVCFLEGNHERWIRDYGNSAPAGSKEFELKTKIQLQRGNFTEKQARMFYRKVRQFSHFTWNGLEVLACHGGIPHMNTNLVYVPTQAFIHGVGQYADYQTIADTWMSETKENIDEFKRVLDINGVGYRVAKQGNNLNLTLGYSHPVVFEAPEGITFDVPNANTIIVRGIDKEVVGQTAAVIRTKRPPEVYRGKGIKYAEEVIRRKEGKTGK